MRPKITRYFSLIPILAAVFCVACAPMTEAQREAREYARVEFREQFKIDRAACLARGGKFVYDGVAEVDRDGVPKSRVMYICA